MQIFWKTTELMNTFKAESRCAVVIAAKDYDTRY